VLLIALQHQQQLQQQQQDSAIENALQSLKL
jgi:hypothetical protein